MSPDEALPPHYWLLQLGNDLPRLIRPDGTAWNIDYRSGKSQQRAAEHKPARQPLARALGIHKIKAAQRCHWHVIDGTAGAGADGWQLAAAGASVTLVEFHPILSMLLVAAIKAATDTDVDAATQAIAQRITVLNERVESVLNNRDPLPPSRAANALYLDPMYPNRRSSAAVKKPMQFIQALVGPGPDPITVLQQGLKALQHSTVARVVVKRPSNASALIVQQNWHGQLVTIDAGAVRFDVYLLPN